jgi:hypothetical protein
MKHNYLFNIFVIVLKLYSIGDSTLHKTIKHTTPGMHLVGAFFVNMADVFGQLFKSLQSEFSHSPPMIHITCSCT